VSTIASRPATGAKPRDLADLSGPRGVPILGNMLQIEVTRAHTTLSQWAREFGPIYRYRVGRRNVVVVSDTELINEALRDRPERFRRRKMMQQGMHDLGIDGVFSAEGADWRRQRKLAMHALNTQHMREFFDRLDAVTGRLQRRWEGAAGRNERVDAQRDLMRFTVDVTSGLAFGSDLNTLEQEGDTIQKHLDKVFPSLARRLMSPIPYWRYIKLKADRELDRAMGEVFKLVNALVATSRARVDANPATGSRPGNFLDAMVAGQGQEGGGFSDAEIVGNVLTMLLAGEDTTANTLAWIMHMMAEHPEVQAKMRAEADRLLGDAQRAPDYATTEAMHYIEAVAHEAMRLKPVAPIMALEPNADLVLGDVRIPQGTPVYFLTGHVARQEANFADGETFRPERWLDAATSSGQAAHNTRAFMPFGAGPRYCPGRHLAMLEIKAVSAMLCRNFTVERAPGPPTEEVFSFTMMPRNLCIFLRCRGSTQSTDS
jgi:cytochrome P450